MMNKMQQSVCALAVLAATTLPAMAESVDVRVIGTITPTACTPTLSGGGTVDYGAINPTTLNAADYTVLGEKQLDFAITCDAPAKVAIKAINGRPNTAAGTTENGISGSGAAPAGVNLFGIANVQAVGLGLDGTSKIGGYGIRIAGGTVTADGVAVDSIQANGNTATWVSANGLGSLYNNNNVRNSSWAASGTLVPIAFTNLAGKLGVEAYLNKASELDLTKPVTLDGLTTIELVYL
ncbi:DUF1120 domain-containing protein [Serratia rubidaea]|uniref:Protein of uncharacterized function (DUF1120) n=1 Tax=Serratia rubidaea TaxID=61652 RepID=A0A448SCJ3_SERRU|nr:DUF1120 domain-containing protein [Serratia rubidaea]VEI65427.1 Protein of uncharacterised function (DUF1120) [Serratia rubidaea]